MGVTFIRRDFPNANSVLLHGARPVLVDAGAPGQEAALHARLGTTLPALLVNTHWHSDHSGGNHFWAARGVPVAASAEEAARLRRGDPDACRAAWLRQDVPPYQVDRSLADGDVVETGMTSWSVIALPGHTAEQIGLFDPAARVLLAGDALHAGDLGWLDLDADPAALDRAAETVERIAALEPRLLLSGHGPAVTDVPAALLSAKRRLQSWREAPERIAWHACKRIFGHQLFTTGGMARPAITPALLDAPWFAAHARRAFGISPEDFVPLLLAEMLRSGAAVWRGDRLMPPGGGALEACQSSPPRR